jgi:precorrin-6A/cobalt-precorrin-6A reductase
MILLLAGTAEARALSHALREAGLPAIASLSGATRAPAPLPLPTRRGGFGGEEGFRAFLRTAGIDAVIDATHPFAARITARTAAVCAALGLPCLRLERPGWHPGPGDRWIRIDSEEEAARHVPPGATVLLATGRQSLGRFAGLAGRRVLLRVIDPPEGPFPWPGGDFLQGRPPFDAAAEEALFRRHRIDWLVAKDSGGEGGRAKLDAARALGLPVLMLRRPPPPPGLRVVADVSAALVWALDLPRRGGAAP